MAEPYLERLTQMVERLELPRTSDISIEPRHFFSGAALYANRKICVSLSPMGLAVKLPVGIREKLISEGNGTEFRFFASGPIKREYVAISETILKDDEVLRKLLISSINFVTTLPNSYVADETG